MDAPRCLAVLTLHLLLQQCYGAAGGRKESAALFVFGDSYADTGNHNASDASLATPWKPPYGNTWPGHPSGRFSDGRVFTDHFASFLRVKRPIPYRAYKAAAQHHHPEHLSRRGINFAFGGSGVFPTFGPQYPNVSTQVKQLRHLLRKGAVSKELIEASTALLVLAGNDYTAYSQEHPDADFQEWSDFVGKVVEEMGNSLQSLLEKVGFRRIAVTYIEPVGCLPGATFVNNYTSCDLVDNARCVLHNSLLEARMSSLQALHPASLFVTLDLYSAFEAVLSDARLSMTPCCADGGGCGSVGTDGQPSYNLCSTPGKMLFWDSVHPTNAGWKAISKVLFASIAWE